MSNVLELDAAAAAAVAGQVERRRPGRIENVNPALIPLLRRGALPPLEEAGDADLDELLFEEDQLAPARGLATAVMLSGGLWGMIGYGLYRFLQ